MWVLGFQGFLSGLLKWIHKKIFVSNLTIK